MSFDHQNMDLVKKVWHRLEGGANGTLELTFESTEQPTTLPAGVRPDLVYGGSGRRISITVPVGKQIDTTPPWIAANMGPAPGGTEDIFIRFNYNETTSTWTQAGRVDPVDWSPM
jgi:hypothetical protein